jgi:hypothetical protein
MLSAQYSSLIHPCLKELVCQFDTLKNNKMVLLSRIK